MSVWLGCTSPLIHNVFLSKFDILMFTTIFLSQIHAFNILRAIYRVSRLGKLVTPYVTDGVKAAILGLSHAHWSVRNSATLLFGALVTRMFGVPRAKDGSDKKTR